MSARIRVEFTPREVRQLLCWIAAGRVSPAWLGVVFDRLKQAVKTHEKNNPANAPH